jgi:hypothetical protein
MYVKRFEMQLCMIRRYINTAIIIIIIILKGQI